MKIKFLYFSTGFVFPAPNFSAIFRLTRPRDLRLPFGVFSQAESLEDEIGLKVKGLLAVPKKDGNYPCLVFNRGGNRELGVIEDLAMVRLLGGPANWGYITIASQYRGNAGGEGQEEFGGKDVDDVLNLLPPFSSIDGLTHRSCRQPHQLRAGSDIHDQRIGSITFLSKNIYTGAEQPYNGRALQLDVDDVNSQILFDFYLILRLILQCENMRRLCYMPLLAAFLSAVGIRIPAIGQSTLPPKQIVHPAELSQVKIDDGFWSPKMQMWSKTTVHDVFDKLEGKYDPDRPDIIEEKAKLGHTRNVLANFDRVARGQKNTGVHDGPPWYDGLLYETIRGAADLLAEHPDPALESRIDNYIDHIAAAQNADPDGYLNTWTTLIEPNRRWGRNGGDDKWQHDVYNSGMLIEAGIHYYQTTKKTKLLKVAVRQANYICAQIGPSPKYNVIPGHGGPEEAMLKLYQLFMTHQELKNGLEVPVDAPAYLAMAQFWINMRGNYGEKDGSHSRKSDSSYNQDQLPVTQQTTIEGHAVRATLLAAGLTATAMETGNAEYAHTADNYWNNMIGRRMFITGGEGAIADGERFGPDFFLPESAYLETCASISSAFFSEKMNEMRADGKYMDEFERILYNNYLSGISLDGKKYFYENPLVGNGNKRWNWHSCPCCPPMILKMAGTLPRYIYATSDDAVFVNLFIGSEAQLNIGTQPVLIKQSTGYPWKGNTRIEIDPRQPGTFSVNVRIPGWALKQENPFGLYHSDINEAPSLRVNGQVVAVKPKDGYVKIARNWKAGDVIELQLPMKPRVVSADAKIASVQGKVAIAAGPIVYGFEAVDNSGMDSIHLPTDIILTVTRRDELLGGINVIRTGEYTAIPFYTLGNRQPGAPYTVWVKQ